MFETSEASRQTGNCPWFYFPHSALIGKSSTLHTKQNPQQKKMGIILCHPKCRQGIKTVLSLDTLPEKSSNLLKKCVHFSTYIPCYTYLYTTPSAKSWRHRRGKKDLSLMCWVSSFFIPGPMKAFKQHLPLDLFASLLLDMDKESRWHWL